MKHPSAIFLVLALVFGPTFSLFGDLGQRFESPPADSRPETWFHLIGGNIDRDWLTTDLEAIEAAGLAGIQLFHGSGNAWEGVSPQIEALSPTWDDMIAHVANETSRLDLKFTMQNCPGWATSGGPWISVDNSMRHLISSRLDLAGGREADVTLPMPQPSNQPWRDYRDVAVLAFPTPANDDDAYLVPARVTGRESAAAWDRLIRAENADNIRIQPDASPAWVEIEFDEPTLLRSIELPPIETLMVRRNFAVGNHVSVQIPDGDSWSTLIRHEIPRASWQDRVAEYPLVLAVPDADSSRYRIVFETDDTLNITFLRLSSGARLHDWRGQAGYAFRSFNRHAPPEQDPAAWVDPEEILDLSEHMDDSGRLTWDAPAGDWTVLRFGHVNIGQRNKPAPPEATGWECDKLSPTGAEQHFAGYIGRLTEPGAPAEGHLEGMLIDSWEAYTQTWTPRMESEFQDRRGYALRNWLPALAGYVIDDPRSSERFLRDWRATVSDLMVHNYFGRLGELARDRGIKLSFETAMGEVIPGDLLQYHGKADIPMCEFWLPNDPHNAGLHSKPIHPTVSAAHVYGKKRVAAEAFTNHPADWNLHPFAMKAIADRHMALGVTQFVFHTYTHNPLDEVPGTTFGRGIGSPFLRGQTWWKHMPHFTDYLGRCQVMLEAGNPVSDVLWYLGDDLNHRPPADAPFPDGYQFDYLNFDVLANRLSVEEGKLTIPEGTTWEVIWLDPDSCRRLTPATLARLRELIRDGATVIGHAPGMNPSLVGGPEADEAFTRLVESLWGAEPGESGERRIGEGRLLWGGSLEDHLAALDIQPDLYGARSATWLHRRDGDKEIYFVAADRATALDANLRFRATGRPELWDPLTGTTTPVTTGVSDGKTTTIPLRLPAAGSTFVVFHTDESARLAERIAVNGELETDATDATRVDRGEPHPVTGLLRTEPIQPWVEPPALAAELTAEGLLAWSDGTHEIRFAEQDSVELDVSGTRSLPVEAGWTLEFPGGSQAEGLIEIDQPKPWTDLEDPEMRHFSGSATYRVEIDFAARAPEERFLLDLGRVANIAAVRINGEQAGVLWAAPYRADITDWLRPGANTLEIEITNTWHNRLTYDANLPAEERITWNNQQMPPRARIAPAGLLSTPVIHIGKLVPVPDR